MGITKLHAHLKPLSRDVDVAAYAGCSVGVDASAWLHRAYHGARAVVGAVQPGGRVDAHGAAGVRRDVDVARERFEVRMQLGDAHVSSCRFQFRLQRRAAVVPSRVWSNSHLCGVRFKISTSENKLSPCCLYLAPL